MFVFLVLGLILCQQVVSNAAGPTPAHDVGAEMASPCSASAPLNNDLSEISTAEKGAKYSFHAHQQYFYLQGPPGWEISVGFPQNLQDVSRKLPADYLPIDGIGAYKVHTTKRTWNRARQTCVDEGGYLTDIRSDEEEKALVKMLTDKSIGDAWVGYHDLFEEGFWLSVVGEPLERIRWSTKFNPNPDNYKGIQHCSRLVANAGLDDDTCAHEKSFVCKISNDQGYKKN